MSSNSSLPALATIQKLLNIVPYRQHEKSLLQYLFCSEIFGIPHKQSSRATVDSHDSLYSLSSVGVLLAGYMLMHLLKSSSSNSIKTSKDIFALLTWVEKPIATNQDDLRSLLYSLDVLCTFRPQL